MTGVSGSTSERAAVVTASARSLPALMCGVDEGVTSNITCAWPATRSVSAGVVPRYGTWTMSTPVMNLNNSPKEPGRTGAPLLGQALARARRGHRPCLLSRQIGQGGCRDRRGRRGHGQDAYVLCAQKISGAVRGGIERPCYLLSRSCTLSTARCSLQTSHGAIFLSRHKRQHV